MEDTRLPVVNEILDFFQRIEAINQELFVSLEIVLDEEYDKALLDKQLLQYIEIGIAAEKALEYFSMCKPNESGVNEIEILTVSDLLDWNKESEGE